MKKMNKWKLNLMYAVWCITAMTAFTSCLEGGKNTYGNSTVGVVRLETKTSKNVLDIPDAYGTVAIHSPAFAEMRDGACCYVVYEIDFDAPENDPAVLQANGYYTATVSNREEVDRYVMSSLMTDTAQALENETAITTPIPAGGLLGYVKGMIFQMHQLRKPQDQKESWLLSYDPQHMLQEENGRHLYNVYLRAAVRASDTMKSPAETYVLCAYDMKYFLETAAQREKSINSSVFYIRYNYVSELKDGLPVWTYEEQESSAEWILPTQTDS
jgi:hypothetical protein